MVAPTLQAEGGIAAVTAGSLTITLPAHATDDILVCTVMVWAPSTIPPMATIPTPSGWTKVVGIYDTGGTEISYYWRRATSGSETNPVFTRGLNWDTGTDTCYAGRAYVIRGCITSGNPWDEIDPTTAYTTTTGPFDAVTVSGSERLVVQFGGMTDNASWGAAPSGWTAGTAVTSTTGKDAGFQTFRKDNVSANTSADESNVTAPAQGGYLFFGVSFKPPVGGATEQFIAAAIDISPSIATALAREAFLAVALDVSPGIATALIREAFIASALDVSPAINTSLTREAFLSSALDISPSVASSLTRGAFIASALDISPAIDTALTIEQFMAAADALELAISTSISATAEQLLASSLDISPSISTALIREQFLSAAFDIALTINDAITREAFLSVALDIAPLIDTNITGGTGVSLHSRLTLGVG